jgi:hypothetical protein
MLLTLLLSAVPWFLAASCLEKEARMIRTIITRGCLSYTYVYTTYHILMSTGEQVGA